MKSLKFLAIHIANKHNPLDPPYYHIMTPLPKLSYAQFEFSYAQFEFSMENYTTLLLVGHGDYIYPVHSFNFL
jgi:hypothetical protein